VFYPALSKRWEPSINEAENRKDILKTTGGESILTTTIGGEKPLVGLEMQSDANI